MKGAEAAVQAGKKLAGALEKYKFVLLVLLAGILLLVLPLPGGGGAEELPGETAAAGAEFDLDALERRMEAALSRIEGAGEVSVVLTLRSGTRQVLAQDVSSARSQEDQEEDRTTVVVSAGSGSDHRNHCPNCLSSLHVDEEPGDRASDCGGLMDPIGVWVRKNGEWAVIHRCRRCGKLSSNRVAADDNPMKLMSIALKPLTLPPFPLERIQELTVLMGGDGSL